MKNNSKGFTLVELLASLVILGLLAAVAAPNIIGILQSTKLNMYVEDANKLSTLAQYKFKGDSSVTRPTNGRCIVMNMKYLGKSEFKNSPYGDNGYSDTKSFVLIKRDGNTYKYYVQLIEEVDGGLSGIKTVDKNVFSTDDKYTTINTKIGSSDAVDFNSNSQSFATDKDGNRICDGVIDAFYLE